MVTFLPLIPHPLFSFLFHEALHKLASRRVVTRLDPQTPYIYPSSFAEASAMQPVSSGTVLMAAPTKRLAITMNSIGSLKSTNSDVCSKILDTEQ